MADSTSAAREAAIPKDDTIFSRWPPPSNEIAIFRAGAQWARSHPRVVSEAAVEATARDYAMRRYGLPLRELDADARAELLGDLHSALRAAYAVEEQQE